MRFKSQLRNPGTFAKLCASLASIGPLAFLRLNDDEIRFVIRPDHGSSVYAQVRNENMFLDPLVIESAAEKNTINLEVPIAALQRVLRSAVGATTAQLRLTKKQQQPILCLTITTNTLSSRASVVAKPQPQPSDEYGDFDFDISVLDDEPQPSSLRDRETTITQDIPVRVLSMDQVAGLHEPRTPEPDVHIHLPPLHQVKGISERFTRLALGSSSTTKSSTTTTSASPKLILSATMHGHFRISTTTPDLSISSQWSHLMNPDLDPGHFASSQEWNQHPSAKMKALGDAKGENAAGWASVRIDAKDWSRVLSVGRLNAQKVIACLITDVGVVLYVFVELDDGGLGGLAEEQCLTYYVGGFSA